MEISSCLSRSFLFRGIEQDTLSEILSHNPPEKKSFRRGELVYSSESKESLVGFVLSGRLEVRLDRGEGSKTVLNILSEGGSFGVLSIYSAEEFPTHIFATKNSEILFFSAEKIKYFVNNYSQISANLIHFLAERISFLNKKIATFSASRVDMRLAAFLLSECVRVGNDRFAFNAQKTSEEINAGRASVYRAISSLTEEGLIELVDKKIYIKDRVGLERITK